MITFITGGIKSGKSNQAVALAKKANGKIAFIATAIPFDTEMQERIKKHQESRPKEWDLIEESTNLAKALNRINQTYDTVLIDCMGLFVSNLLLNDLSNEAILKEIDLLADTVKQFKNNLIIVSNEVGSSLIPENKLGRCFCDLLGTANQKLASIADQAILMAAGCPITIK